MSPVQFLAHKFPGKTEQEYRSHLGNFQITGMTGLQTLATLSGGQKSRVAFSVLSMQRPHVLLLDEVCAARVTSLRSPSATHPRSLQPTNHLDIEVSSPRCLPDIGYKLIALRRPSGLPGFGCIDERAETMEWRGNRNFPRREIHHVCCK
jgi:hypothetical protein